MTERKHWRALKKRLAVYATYGPAQALVRYLRAIRPDIWFPNVPLALAVGLAGVLQFLPVSGSLKQLLFKIPVPVSGFHELSDGFTSLAIRGVPQELIGGILMLLSLGLAARSRLAWLMTILFTVGAIWLQVATAHGVVSAVTWFGLTLLAALLLTRDEFSRSNLAVATLFALSAVLMTLGYGVLGSYVLGKGFAPPITSFLDALYFSIMTLSTVGYGDIVPKTPDARAFTVSLVMLGLAVFAASLTTIVGPIINNRMKALLEPRKKPMKRNNHIIVAGANPLARNVVNSLTKRGIEVTAIWREAPQSGIEAPADLIIGDATNSEVLESAGVKSARAVLALKDNDADNAFVTLAAKDANPDVKTLLAVNDAHNMDRMRRVKPDAVLALPVIGAELVAMALSGEEPHTDQLLEQLLRLD